MQRAGALRAAVTAVAATLAVAWPVTRALEDDSYPLSNYPMFTADLPAATTFVRAIGVGADGDESVLPPQLSGGTIEVVHANRTLRRAVREGRADEMCGEIADRVADDDGHGTTVIVLVVVERYDIIAGLRASDPEPIDRDVRARCEVAERS